MNTAWVQTVAPLAEPIGLDDAKANLRVEVSTEDDLIKRLLRGTRAQVEDYLNRALLPQTWKYTQDTWANEMRLPRAPLRSVTSVKYYDTAGVLQTLSPTLYVVDTVAEPGAVRIAPTQIVWPVLQPWRLAAVEITYVAGYTDAATIPPAILDAVHLLLARRYLRRGDDSPDGAAGPLDSPAAEALLAPYRVFWRPPVGCSR